MVCDSKLTERLVEFCRDFSNEILSSYLPLKLFRDHASHLVVQAKDLQNETIVLLKVISTADEPGYLMEWSLPHALPVPLGLLPLKILRSVGFVALVFPFLEDAVHCYPHTSQMWLEVLQQLFQALNALHLKNYAHLDVKPSNVLIREQDGGLQVFLIDFGCAELIGHTQLYGDNDDGDYDDNDDDKKDSSSGTYPFVDPVYVETGTPSTKSDIWSVGVMVARAILTEPYFPNVRPSLSESLQLSKAFPEYFNRQTRESFIPTSYDEALVGVIRHLLVLDQEQRWSSAMALQKISEILKINQ